MSATETYFAPTSLDEAVALLAGGDAVLYAGGTDLVPQIRSGVRSLGPRLVNIRRIPELKGISVADGEVRIGAMTTVTEILEDDDLRALAPVLRDTADCFACGQVRNSATLGGNICNASPAGDLIIPLLLLDAKAELVSWSDGARMLRVVPIQELFTGPGGTRMRADEILTSVVFAEPPGDFVAGFSKLGTRPAMDISVVSVGVAGRTINGALTDVRIAYGAVAPIPMRALRAEAALEGRALDEAAVADALLLIESEISPISDVRASAWYRTEVAKVLTRRLLRDVLSQGN